jgi:hypothetical protein
MSHKKIFIWLIVAVVVIAAVVWFGMSYFKGSQNPSGASPYAAVYFTNGQIYFGKLSWMSGHSRKVRRAPASPDSRSHRSIIRSGVRSMRSISTTARCFSGHISATTAS